MIVVRGHPAAGLLPEVLDRVRRAARSRSGWSRCSVPRLLGDAKPRLLATDPPYGVKLDPTGAGRAL
jgi:hypothetical protein